MRQRGNALVEFAVILPVALTITLGLIGVGRFAYFGIVVANAARAGAQYGAQRGSQAASDTSGMVAAAQADAANNGVGSVTSPAPSATDFCTYWDSSTSTATADPNCAPAPTPGTQHVINYVQVTVQGTANSGFSVPFLPSQVTISSTATQRVSP